MRIWKNGQDVPYMYGEDKLTREMVQRAVHSMSFSGLEIAAASFLLLAQSCGKTPAQTMKILETDTTPVSYVPELTLEGGSSETVHQRRNQWDH